jgi:hypothetical protein
VKHKGSSGPLAPAVLVKQPADPRGIEEVSAREIDEHPPRIRLFAKELAEVVTTIGHDIGRDPTGEPNLGAGITGGHHFTSHARNLPLPFGSQTRIHIEWFAHERIMSVR